MHVTSLVENAAHEGSRYAITGSSYGDLNPEGLSREEFISQYIRKRVGLWVSEDEQIDIQTTVVGNVVDLGNGGADDSEIVDRGGLGAGGQAVIYNVTYYWHIMTPMMDQIIGDENGSFPITASVVVKNEDFCGARHCPGAP